MTCCPCHPRELRRLEREQLDGLAAQIRLSDATTCRARGSPSANLSVVELTIGLHHVFRSPGHDRLRHEGARPALHKLLTKGVRISPLRSSGRIVRLPSRSESEHDVLESLPCPRPRGVGEWHSREEKHRHGERVDGRYDGARSQVAWRGEALSNIAASEAPTRIVIVNDNEFGYGYRRPR